MTVEREVTLPVERALPWPVWNDIRAHARLRSTAIGEQHWRIVHALMLLLGDSELRREEAAGAGREALHSFVADDGTESWTLVVIRMRRRERTVPASPETVGAIRAHWRDRSEDFDAPAAANSCSRRSSSPIPMLPVANTRGSRGYPMRPTPLAGSSTG